MIKYFFTKIVKKNMQGAQKLLKYFYILAITKKNLNKCTYDNENNYCRE